jgi:hypothetical protein
MNEMIRKLSTSDKYANLPFNILTLQLLGDKSLLFESMGVKMINPIIDLAIEQKWSAITNFEKVKGDIRKIRDHALRDFYLSLCSSYIK